MPDSYADLSLGVVNKPLHQLNHKINLFVDIYAQLFDWSFGESFHLFPVCEELRPLFLIIFDEKLGVLTENDELLCGVDDEFPCKVVAVL